MRRAAERVLDARLAQEPGLSRLLDAGCGRGDFTLSLASRYPGLRQILGCDFSPELLELARTGASGDARVRFRDGDLTELPFAAASVDVTVCLNVLHHVNPQALSVALGELARVTTRVLLLEIKNARSPYFRLHSGRVEGVAVFPTGVRQVRAALGPLGFELVRRRGIFGLEWLSPLVLLQFERAGSHAR
jgi:ubiquinone/menaquinone biosynthesis C-methylase UbiE